MLGVHLRPQDVQDGGEARHDGDDDVRCQECFKMYWLKHVWNIKYVNNNLGHLKFSSIRGNLGTIQILHITYCVCMCFFGAGSVILGK